ncbi:MAG: hypothetical protein ACXWCM_14425 [Acidimicrobiales bacterium]
MPASSFARGGGFAALAAAIPLMAPAVAGAAPLPPATSATSQPYCSTQELTPEQMAAGEISHVTCFGTLSESLQAVGIDAPKGATTQSLLSENVVTATGVAAVHYKSANGTGEYLSVAGDGCDGGGLSFAAGDSWNDTILSTRHRLCSQVKHYSDADYGGNVQTTDGSNGTLVQMNSQLARQVSSIKYQGTVNS